MADIGKIQRLSEVLRTRSVATDVTIVNEKMRYETEMRLFGNIGKGYCSDRNNRYMPPHKNDHRDRLHTRSRQAENPT